MKASMSKEKKVIKVMGSIENTLRNMPKYNAYQCGVGEMEPKSGKHAKRARRKSALRKEIKNYYNY